MARRHDRGPEQQAEDDEQDHAHDREHARIMGARRAGVNARTEQGSLGRTDRTGVLTPAWPSLPEASGEKFLEGAGVTRGALKKKGPGN
jgi:hypothetical protein